MLVFEGGGETTLAACLARGEHLLRGVGLTEKRVTTNIAMVHEPGHLEPWIIAMSEAPTVHRAFDDGLRRGGDRGDVLRLQDARLWPGGQSSSAS